MSEHRRQFVREPGPFAGAWTGAQGTTECRITNLSPNGCFVDSPQAPGSGAEVAVTVAFGDGRFSVPGEVVYLDQFRGFGVRFSPSEPSRALAYAMGIASVAR